MVPVGDNDAGYTGFAVVEIMGHRRLAGRISDALVAGAPMLRIDVPDAKTKDLTTHFFAPHALYAIHPCTEDTARRVASLYRPEPVAEWDLQLLLTATAGVPVAPLDGEDPDLEREPPF